MNLNQINYLNIGLMFFSLILALKLPFELFLFSYAVLGPLHYFTEINWLHDKKYFTQKKNDFIYLIMPVVITTVGVLLYEFQKIGWISKPENPESLMASVINWLSESGDAMVFTGLGLALVFVFVKDNIKRLILGLIILGIALLLQGNQWYLIAFAVFTPTIIHVFVFTGLFILYGALKSKSLSGYISFFIFLLCAIILLNYTPDTKNYNLDGYVKDVFVQSGFDGLNYNIYKILYPMEGKRFIVDSALGLKIQSLIAFAYTYHYLNWFSKTSIIKWHQVSKLKLCFTVLMWIGSVGLYLYNYRVGLLTLFFVSMIHVFLEFPLNIRSITGIGEELKKIYSPSSGKYST